MYEELTENEIDAELAHLDAVHGAARKLILDAMTADFHVHADLEDFYKGLDDLIADHLAPLVDAAEMALGIAEASAENERTRHARIPLTTSDKARIANALFDPENYVAGDVA